MFTADEKNSRMGKARRNATQNAVFVSRCTIVTRGIKDNNVTAGIVRTLEGIGLDLCGLGVDAPADLCGHDT